MLRMALAATFGKQASTTHGGTTMRVRRWGRGGPRGAVGTVEMELISRTDAMKRYEEISREPRPTEARAMTNEQIAILVQSCVVDDADLEIFARHSKEDTIPEGDDAV